MKGVGWARRNAATYSRSQRTIYKQRGIKPRYVFVLCRTIHHPELVLKAAGVWAVLSAFGYSSIQSDLEGSKAHRLENIMTLHVDPHNLFDTLRLWLEAIPEGVSVALSA